MPITEFQLITKGDINKIQVGITKVVIAGWTGRNKEAMEEHMAELEAIGIARPKTAPIFYRVSADLLTQNKTISVVGWDSSGEVDFFVLKFDEGLCIGVGSDHTDRKWKRITSPPPSKYAQNQSPTLSGITMTLSTIGMI